MEFSGETDGGRILALAGAQNFREVAGYPTVDGRRLARGLLWRSAQMDALTPQDVETIHALGIKVVVDLRRVTERTRRPTSEQLLSRMEVMAWDIRQVSSWESFIEAFKAGDEDSHHVQAMLHLYREMIDSHRVQFRGVCRAAADGRLPILVHCAAGKDRTGLAIALILELIGVPREHVLADYAKTETLLDLSRMTGAEATAGAATEQPIRLSAAAMRRLFRSDPVYLETILTELETRHGSIRDFAREVLDLDDALVEQLRERLLEA